MAVVFNSLMQVPGVEEASWRTQQEGSEQLADRQFVPLVRRGAEPCREVIHSQTEAGETGIELWCSRKTFFKCFLVVVAEVRRRVCLREAMSAMNDMDMARASMPKVRSGALCGGGGAPCGTDLPSMVFRWNLVLN